MLSTLKIVPSLFNLTYWKKIGGEIKLIYQLMMDARIPTYLKIFPILVGIYLLSPLDLIPEFLPIIGQLDDLGLLIVALSMFIRWAPDDVVAEYRPNEIALATVE